MPRTNTNAELFAELDRVGVIRDVSSGVETTIATAAVDEGDTEIEVADGTGLAAGDLLRIGTGAVQEVAVIEGVVDDTITLVSELAYDHAIGEDVVEQERTVLGDVTDDGVGTELQIGRSQINAATQKERYAFLDEYVNGRVTFGVLNHSIENLLASLGIDEANIHGAGSAADPYVADETPDDINAVENQSFYFTGSLKNGTVVEVQLWRTSVDANRAIQYVRGGDGNPIPFAVDYGHRRTISPAA